MAGGWGKQGSGVPLSERVRASGHSPAPGHTSGPAPGGGRRELHATGDECPARHCWVSDADPLGVKRPGLLVEWRAAASGWEGRVVYAASLRAGRWSLVEEWVPASRLTPL